MKFPKEYYFILVIGLYIISNILEMFIPPLNLNLSSPYQYLDQTLLYKYPFTATIILLRSLALFITPLLILTYLPLKHLVKGILLLILAGLTQLYAIQQIATHGQVLPLEWSLSLSLTCFLLLIPILYQLLVGTIFSLHSKIKPKTDKTDLKL